MIVKKASIDNLQSVKQLNQELFEHDYKFDNTLDGSWPSRNEKYYKDRISKSDSITLVAVEAGDIVGYLIGCIVTPEDYRKTKNMAELENMFVKKEHRGKKIGSQMIKEFFKWAKSKGIKRLRVIASAQNKEAIEVYKKNSFFEYSSVLEANI